jgi:two-component system NtrC family sensor kinase
MMLEAEDQALTSTELVELAALVDHRESVQATATVESVYDWFKSHQQEYIGVLAERRFLGLVSRGQVGFLLGARFGFAIYGRQPIGSNLMDQPLQMPEKTPLLTVLEEALSRSGDRFYDDVALVDEAGEYLGIITVPTLVHWQSRLILEKTRLAEEQRRALQENNGQLFRSLNELRQSRGRYEILFENSALKVALLNARGEIETCNRRLESLLGREEGVEAAGREPWDLSTYVVAKERGAFLHLLHEHEEHPDDSETRTSEFMLQLPGRGPRLFKVYSNWVQETGQVCLLVNDITEQRVLEHRLIQKEKSALLDSLVGGIAHEINNKLAPIVGYSELLQMEISRLKEIEKLGPYCDIIRNAAMESAKIIRQLLQLSRPLARELAVVDLHDLFTEVQALLRFRLRESGCRVETEFMADPAPVYADAAQIKQVMINLIFNALDAMEKAAEKRLRLSILAVSTGVAFRVADTGHGIKPENLNQIYNPFYTTKSADRGSGLGLSVCLNVVKSHSGDISVESTPGAGTEFTVTLPRATDEQIQKPRNGMPGVAATGRGPDLQGRNGRLRILIADDEEFVTGMVQEALRQSMACLVERVESGQRAVVRLQQADFDLVISDVRMPGMDGFGLFEWILKHQPHLVSRFLFITGDAGSQSMNEQLESMVVPVLRKPFEIEALVACCRTLLER